jgi:DNA-binding FadR family transcriptional regulator
MEGSRDAKHIASLRVALYLLRYHSKYPDQPIPLSNMALKEWGVSRDQKRRAIPELESLGLIQVEQRGKASALAKLLL